MHPLDETKEKNPICLWSLTVRGAIGAIFSLEKYLRDNVDLSGSASSADASRNDWERYTEQIGAIILPC